MVKALFNAVIVKKIEQDESTYGTIVVPDMGKEKNHTAEVVAVGPGQYTQNGSFVDTILSVGDIVIVPQFIVHFTRPNLVPFKKRIISFDFRLQ